MRSWVLLAAFLTALVALVRLALQPPRPRAADAPATVFAEARARRITDYLADSVGVRVLGSPARDRAAAYLVEQLRRIPGIEVTVQDTLVSRVQYDGRLAVQYRVKNVLARLPGEQPDAILISAHYDSPPESPGAGDDAASVGAAVEVLRTLASGPMLPRTVILNLNDGEEMGLLGTAAFVRHPWVRQVRAFINLDNAGTGGRSILFQTGPGEPWMVRAFARAAPRPYGTAIAQDVFQSGVIPSDTDFRIYRDEGGIRGYDFALVEDGYAYHTALDRPARLARGSVQHIGDNTLALVRRLMTTPFPSAPDARRGIYYDLLSLVMVTYDDQTATRLGLGIAGFALLALLLAMQRGAVDLGDTLLGAVVAAGAAVAGLAAAAAGGALLSFVVRRPAGWYAAPWTAWLAFGALALAGCTAVHALWERHYVKRRSLRERRLRGRIVFTAAAGTMLFWAIVLVLLSWRGAAVAYLPLWWTGGLALAVAAGAFRPDRLVPLLVVFGLPAAVLTLEAGMGLVSVFVPIAGRMGGIPLDLGIALLIAITVLTLAFAGVATVHAGGHLGRAAAGLALAGCAGVALCAVRDPYSAERPKRLRIEHRDEADRTRLVFFNLDAIPLRAALAGVDSARAALPDEGFARGTWVAPRPAERLATPELTVLRTTTDSATGERVVDAIVSGGAWTWIDIRVPSHALAGWSFSDSLPPKPALRGEHWARVIGVPADGWPFQLRLKSDAPVTVSLSAAATPATTAALTQVFGRLPDWVTASALMTVRRTVTIGG